MDDARARQTVYPIIVLLGLLVTAGCTTNYKVDTKSAVDYGAWDKLDLAVQLQLSDEFSDYTWEHKTGLGDTFRMKLGPALSNNAEALAKGLFRDAVVSRGAAGGVDGVLTPRVVSVERAMGATALSNMKTIIDLEWALTDRQGKLIWVDTLQGVGEAKTGNIFSHKSEGRKQGNRAIEDVFRKSAEAITGSREVRAFVDSR